ncbi:hypothetical protein PPERSA_06703 [Pseudocohnilembus persalinus]|uniref:2-methoxy-6-polyprenyl-1,4-benzoquinol methylase, mitochondrial n=1 Tax=Pseudocohnilembus persalinus TaxID=266149 RepID=A0A0V0QS73_PSEPJ|nr:hypothetical protein PPERSA_06703 [Pseudocohnilembus persalinus]|eukprot:KRX05069.1 hypothetical protein PPERSA_06703 [Pseudocohnilembus persalinus]
MNDAASLGLHRCWKNTFVNDLGYLKGDKILNEQGQIEGYEQPRVLDVAGGTGDIAFKIIEHHEQGQTNFLGNRGIKVTVCDINQSMLDVGAQRAREQGLRDTNIEFIQGNAEELPFADNTFDAYTISFGIRNVPRIEKALSEAHRVLKQGGRLMILEFSKVDPMITPFYNFYNFNIVPLMGQVISNDRASYDYLAQSIDKFHSQESLLNLIEEAGFKYASFKNLNFGIVAIHSGFKL